MASPTLVVMAVQPGNENNQQAHENEYGPWLRGSTDRERGVSHGIAIVETRAKLDAAGCSNVEVWTTGTTGGGYQSVQQDFLEGVLEAPGALAATAGLCVHCYGYPPGSQLEGAGSKALAAKTNKSSTAKIYATEIGSERLRDGCGSPCETDGQSDVANALYWTLYTGTYYERIFWYTANPGERIGLLAAVPPPDVPGNCGAGGARYSGGFLGQLCERLAGTTFRTWQG